MSESPGDICKCGDDRHEHAVYGPREFWARSRCTVFRLCVTAAELAEGYAEWERIREERGE